MDSQSDRKMTPEAIEEATQALSKLPILGPALWLYARDPIKKFMFVGDIDATVLPPIILDQCRLYTKNNLPYAFVTWALVNDEIDSRLRSTQPKLAPHEWKSGENVWLIDMIAPFGHLDETLQELRKSVFPGRRVSALVPTGKAGNEAKVVDWAPDDANTQ